MRGEYGLLASRIAGKHELHFVNSVFDLVIGWIQYYAISSFAAPMLFGLSGTLIFHECFLHESEVFPPPPSSRYPVLISLVNFSYFAFPPCSSFKTFPFFFIPLQILILPLPSSHSTRLLIPSLPSSSPKIFLPPRALPSAHSAGLQPFNATEVHTTTFLTLFSPTLNCLTTNKTKSRSSATETS